MTTIKTLHGVYKRKPHKEQGSDIAHERFKNPYDNLLYCILLQAVRDKETAPYECTLAERRTAKTFFDDGTAKVFYDYLKECKRK